MSHYKHNEVFEGLGTVTIVIPAAGRYSFDGKISLPKNSDNNAQSSLVVVINKNGSPMYTGFAGAQGFFVKILCAAADSITIVFSSADLDDQSSNVIKSTISVSECV